MSVKDKRARAEANKAKAANNEFNKSLHSAEMITDPWQSAQMLAYVARMEAPDDSVLRTAKKAFKAAQETDEPYRRVAASLPAVYALIERKKNEAAQEAILDLLDETNHIRHPVSRLYALELLWQATFPLANATIEKTVLAALISACQNANSWRAGRAMRFIAQVVATNNKVESQRIIDTMPESRYKRQAQTALDAERVAAIHST